MSIPPELTQLVDPRGPWLAICMRMGTGLRVYRVLSWCLTRDGKFDAVIGVPEGCYSLAQANNHTLGFMLEGHGQALVDMLKVNLPLSNEDARKCLRGHLTEEFVRAAGCYDEDWLYGQLELGTPAWREPDQQSKKEAP